MVWNVGSANVGSANVGSANVGSVNVGSANVGSAKEQKQMRSFMHHLEIFLWLRIEPDCFQY
jgi:hypothetical protein